MTHASEPRSAGLHECGVCAQQRAHGEMFRTSDAAEVDAIWICTDCQHKLLRRVDDEGVRGG